MWLLLESGWIQQVSIWTLTLWWIGNWINTSNKKYKELQPLPSSTTLFFLMYTQTRLNYTLWLHNWAMTLVKLPHRDKRPEWVEICLLLIYHIVTLFTFIISSLGLSPFRLIYASNRSDTSLDYWDILLNRLYVCKALQFLFIISFIVIKM